MRKYAVAAAVLAAGLVVSATAASAHHNVPVTTTTEPGACGEVTIGAQWSEDTHIVDNTVLVVQAGGEQFTAPVGESITVGPFETAPVTVRYRVWGGGERNYDQPALTDLDALVAHLDAGGSPLDGDAPGVAWFELEVEGCVPGPEGPEGPSGDDGETGADGSDGVDGEDGADAVSVAQPEESAPATAVTAEPAFTG